MINEVFANKDLKGYYFLVNDCAKFVMVEENNQYIFRELGNFKYGHSGSHDSKFDCIYAAFEKDPKARIYFYNEIEELFALLRR